MDFIWILFAFTCGLAMRLVALPPLVGYLAAGFALHFLGFQPAQNLDTLANIGITLMLFSIGLKLNIKDLLTTEIWLGTSAAMVLWIVLCSSLLMLAAAVGLSSFTNLSLSSAALLAFASSFSSTVCVVKLLEESGEMKTRHGKLAIGILVMQDIVAVGFLVFATGKVPSLWALLLLLLIPLRPLLGRLLQEAGHGELLPLMGFFLALGGYELFSMVNIKGDLGALLLGILLASHGKASELAKSLLSFKDLFLIGFFLSIGFTALPDWGMLAMALAICLLLPLKYMLFLLLLSGLRLRARSAYLTSMALTNFSEFGLIVAAISVDNGWLDKEWLVTLALAVSFSFALTSGTYRHAHSIYSRYKHRLKRYERSKRLPRDVYPYPIGAEVLVIGMGRVGKGAYEALYQQLGDRVWGLDADRQRVVRQKKQGMHVCVGDGEDADYWEGYDISSLRLVLLALPSMEDAANVTQQLKLVGYQGQIAAIARYDDESELLHAAGIDRVFNFYTEAGTGFAEESMAMLR